MSKRMRRVSGSAIIVALVGIGLSGLRFQAKASGSPGVWAFLPGDAMGFLALDWKRIAAAKAFDALALGIDQLLGMIPKVGVLYRKARINLRQIEGVAVAVRLEGKQGALLVAATGAFDKSAIESLLRDDLGLAAQTVGGASLWGKRGGGPVTGFLRPDLFVYGSPSIVADAAALATGKGASISGSALVTEVVSRVDSKAIIVAAAQIPDLVRAMVAKKLTKVALPSRLAFSLDDKDTGTEVKAALEMPAEGDAAKLRGFLDAAVGKLLPKIEGMPLPPKLKEMALGFLKSVKLTAQGKVLEASAGVRLGDQGLVGLLGSLSAMAMPAITRYVHAAKTTEAKVNLLRIQKAAATYYEQEKKLPPSVGPTPSGSPCDHPDKRYPVDPKAWEHPTWKALGFSIEEPHYFRYSFHSSAAGFTARANGDLDCDGSWSTFEAAGAVEGEGEVRGAKPRSIDPLE